MATKAEATAPVGTYPATEAERHGALFEQAPGFVMITSGHGHVVEFVNRGHRRLFDSGTWLGKPIRAASADGADRDLFDLLDRVYETGIAHKEANAPMRLHRSPDGDEAILHADVTYAPVFDGEGSPIGVFCHGFDVADRTEAAPGTLSTEDRLRLATDAADIGWWDVEEGHGRLYWPPRVKAMFGISADMPVTMDDFYAGLHPEDRDRVAAAYAAAADPSLRALYNM